MADDTTAGRPLKVKVHLGICEGWGNCHRWAPEVYPLDDEGYIAVHLLEVPPELADAARLGASSCPAGVITIVGESGPARLPAPAAAVTVSEVTLSGGTS